MSGTATRDSNNEFDVMISYSWRKEKDFVRSIAKRLQEEKKMKVWIDINCMKPGQYLNQMIVQAINNSKVVIPCISSEYRNSDVCKKEINYASNNNRQLLPIYLDNNPKVHEVDFLIAGKLYINFCDKNGNILKDEKFEEMFQELCEGLTKILGPLGRDNPVPSRRPRPIPRQRRIPKEESAAKNDNDVQPPPPQCSEQTRTTTHNVDEKPNHTSLQRAFDAISRAEAENTLHSTSDGTFLIRYSQRKKSLILSVKNSSCVSHLVIQKDDKNFSIDEKKFPSLGAMVTYFRDNYINIAGAQILLTQFISNKKTKQTNSDDHYEDLTLFIPEWNPVLRTKSYTGVFTRKTAVRKSQPVQRQSSMVENPTDHSVNDHFVAKYDYNALTYQELTIKSGDVIRVLDRNPNGMWKGELNGKQGLFPSTCVYSNYVQPSNENEGQKVSYGWIF